MTMHTWMCKTPETGNVSTSLVTDPENSNHGNININKTMTTCE